MQVFRKLNIDHAAVELDKIPEGDKIQDSLERITGLRTIPLVFIKGKCIGGRANVELLYITNKIRRELRGCCNMQRNNLLSNLTNKAASVSFY